MHEQVPYQLLSCSFESDTCLWFNAGDGTWLRGAGNTSEGGWWIEAGNGSVGGEFVMQSARFSLAGDRFLKFSYQLAGSADAFLEVQHQTTPGEWTSLFLERGDKGPAWHSTTVTIPGNSTVLRLVAGAAEQDTAKVREVQALLGLPAQFLPGLGEVPTWIVHRGSGSYNECLNARCHGCAVCIWNL